MEQVRAYVDTHPKMKRATLPRAPWRCRGTAANVVLHVAKSSAGARSAMN